MKKSRKVDQVPVDKSKKYLWAYLKEKFSKEEKGFFAGLFSPFRLTLIGVTASALILTLIFTQNLGFIDIVDTKPNTVYASFEMFAEKEDGSGVDMNSGFIIKSSEDLDLEIVRKALSFESDNKFYVEKNAPSEYFVKSTSPLNPGSLVNFKIASNLDNFSFTYQIKSDFKVMASIPSDSTVSVPINSGIEIKLSHDNFDFSNVSKFFEISPKIDGEFKNNGNVLVFIPKNGLKASTIYTVKLKEGFSVLNSDLKLSEDFSFQFETGNLRKEGAKFLNFASKNIEIAHKQNLALKLNWNSASQEEIKIEILEYKNGLEFFNDFKAINDLPIWSSAYKNSLRFDKKNLRSVGIFDAEIRDYKYRNYLYVPGLELEKGFYLIEIQDDERSQILVQVSDLALYSNISLNNSIFWTMNLASGKPSNKTKIEFLNTNEIINTDKDGIAFIKTPKAFDQDYTKMPAQYVHSKDEFSNELYTVLFSNYSEKSKFYEYDRGFSFDRPIYLPNDSVKFWGFVKKKNGESISRVTAKINYSFSSIEESIEIPVENGFLTYDYQLKNAPVGSYYVEFYDKDILVFSSSFEVSNYIKPAYKIDITSPRMNYFRGEDIDFYISAEYFDKTPLAYGKLEYNTNSGSGGIPFSLDEFGKEKITLKSEIAPYSSHENYFNIRSYQYLGVNSPKSEETNISASLYPTVFLADVYLKASNQTADGIAKLTLNANKVDLEKADSSDEYLGFIGDAIANQNIQGNIKKIRFEKFKSGERYDFINKITVEEFSYNRIEEDFGSFNMKTNNSGIAEYEFKVEKDSDYRISFTTSDSAGRVSKAFSYINSGFKEEDSNYYRVSFIPDDFEFKEISFKRNELVNTVVKNNGIALDKNNSGSFLFIESLNGINSYKIQDSPYYDTKFPNDKSKSFYINAVFFDGKEFKNVYALPIELDKKESTLNVEIKTDKESYKPGDEVVLEIFVEDDKGKKHETNLNINIVDEAYYKATHDNTRNPLFDLSSSSPGNIYTYFSHLSSEEFYSAFAMDMGGCFTGDTLIRMADNTEKKIKDIKKGDIVKTFKTPFSNELVDSKVLNTQKHLVQGYYLINGILEATGEHIVFAENRFMTVEDLKIGDKMKGLDGQIIFVESKELIAKPSLVYNFEVENYNTYFANGFYVHNDKGAGGIDSAIRSDFKDNASFASIKTDSFGKAVYKFKLPDNITSFRATVKAVDLDNLKAGLSKSQIVVSKPLFIDSVVHKIYSEKDKPEITVRSFGNALKKGDLLNFEVFENGKELSKFDGEAFKSYYLKLNELKKGDGEVLIKAKSGNNSDALLRKYQVVGSILKQGKTEIVANLSDLSVIKRASEGLTEIRFMDSVNAMYYNELLNLYFNYGSRIDQASIRAMAGNLLEKYFSESFHLPKIDHLSFQWAENGGLSLLPYSSSDLEISAMISLFSVDFENYFSKSMIQKYFKDILNDNKSNTDEKILALAGLAGIKEPVLLDLRKFSEIEGLKNREKLFIGLALAKLGDKSFAKNIFNEFVKTSELKEFSLKDISQLTDQEKALLSILATYLNDKNALNIWRALEVKGIQNEILNIYRLGLVGFSLENTNFEKSEIEFVLNGKTEKFVFDKPRLVHNFFLKTGDSFKIKKVIGDLSSVSFYEETTENFIGDDDLIVSRKYFVDGKNTNSFREGDLVKVEIQLELKRDFAKNSFIATDIIPSGLIPITPANYGVPYYGENRNFVWPFYSEDKEIKFFLNKNKDENIFKAVYFLRAVSPGEYYADPLKIEANDDINIANISKSDFVKVERRDDKIKVNGL
jgi:hypothetical protein